MDFLQNELLEAYREESAESLDRLAQRLEELKSVGIKDVAEAIDDAFRVAHNIKGSATIVGIDSIGTIAHVIEDALSPYRKSGTAPPEKTLNLILKAVTVIEHLGGGEELPDEATSLINRLKEDTAALSENPGPVTLKTEAEPMPPAENPANAVKSSIDESPAASPATNNQFETANIPPVAGTSVRVNIGRLDHLMSYTGELLITHARQSTRNEQLQSLNYDFSAAYAALPANLRTPLQDVSRKLQKFMEKDREELLHFGHLTEDISNAMRRLRMLPLDGVASFWRRTVRESAQKAGKDVNLEIDVSDIELDKHILDGLRDPMMHLLRNAVDHGIEDAAGRAAANKPATGRILIHASVAGAAVKIEISDDGRGFDCDKVATQAVARKLINQEQVAEMSREEILQLLFTAGFSTAKKVNELSGRGVGLDVVWQRVGALGGRTGIAGKSTLGGASFYLNMPVSLVSTRGLLVRTHQSVFAIPIQHVVRTKRVSREDIQKTEGGSAIQIENQKPLRIRWLTGLMAEQRETDPESMTLVVVTNEIAQMGIVVDEVIRVEKFVTKRLPWNLKYVHGINGAIVLGDGSLAVVVDVPGLFESTGQNRANSVMESVKVAEQRASPRILVVDDSLTSRTLERNILTAAGYEVTVAIDGEEAWGKLLESEFDLVVSDVEMPNLDGLNLVRRIRASTEVQQLPVVLVTSKGSVEDISTGAEAGADEYIVKSRFDQRQLLEAVARHI